jgi:UDPglucose--hexose-1-phosphate uridylyltransferase
MRRQRVELPDGREVLFYGDYTPVPLPAGGARAPRTGFTRRWHPLLEEWVVIAAGRQQRTYHPSRAACPLCPSRPGHLTEVPASAFDIAVFENRFPGLRLDAVAPRRGAAPLTPTVAARGRAEVVVYTSEHTGGLATLGAPRLARLVEVWVDRARELESLAPVRYCYVFENRGEVVGVTLHHPHGQIYTYPFVPPIIAREQRAFQRHRRRHGSCLLCDLIDGERKAGTRVIEDSATWTAVVPYYARWAYEVHVTPRRHVSALVDLTPPERRGLAAILGRVAARYDALFRMPMPYIMAMHQRPLRTADPSAYHFHVEFYPPHRTREKLKYLAGSEAGLGVFVSDTLAEEKAAELRAAGPPRKGRR